MPHPAYPSRTTEREIVWAAAIGNLLSPAEFPPFSNEDPLEMITSKRVIALQDTDGSLVLPEFQLDGEGSVIPGLAAVWKVLLGNHLDPWVAASWLRTSQYQFDGQSIVEYLSGGGQLSSAIRVADQVRVSRERL